LLVVGAVVIGQPIVSVEFDVGLNLIPVLDQVLGILEEAFIEVRHLLKGVGFAGLVQSLLEHSILLANFMRSDISDEVVAVLAIAYHAQQVMGLLLFLHSICSFFHFIINPSNYNSSTIPITPRDIVTDNAVLAFEVHTRYSIF
jgi:hypothetical protein